MVSRYFLHLCDRSASVIDGEGIDAAHEDAAVQCAMWTIRDVVANDILAGMPIGLASYVSIQDEDGIELRRVYVRDVVCFREEDPGAAPAFQRDMSVSAFFPAKGQA